MYKLIIAPLAKQQLKKIPPRYKYPLKLLLGEIKEDPSYGKPLGRELTGKLSIRVGVHRVVYKVNEKDKTVLVITAGHRATVYKRK
ncbi:MAG: type II toxin-antitoxin system RelE/ParE family toxin [Patescibacteria group bacterium]